MSVAAAGEIDTRPPPTLTGSGVAKSKVMSCGLVFVSLGWNWSLPPPSSTTPTVNLLMPAFEIAVLIASATAAAQPMSATRAARTVPVATVWLLPGL